MVRVQPHVIGVGIPLGRLRLFDRLQRLTNLGWIRDSALVPDLSTSGSMVRTCRMPRSRTQPRRARIGYLGQPRLSVCLLWELRRQADPTRR